MAKQKRGSVGPAPKNSKDLNSDLTGNGTYKGEIPAVIGTHRLLIKGKSDYVYVKDHRVAEMKEKYGKDFIRDLGKVKVDPRPEMKQGNVSYLV